MRTIEDIHSKINLVYGKLTEELPEQKMVVNNLNGDEKVLEIGGNYGRNSCVIATILKDSSNLVVLESNDDFIPMLKANKNRNLLNFNIEPSALSKRRLIQKDLDTKPSEVLETGYKWVSTITYEELLVKYGIIFDTLVLDCEGAFYYILMDYPYILNNLKLIIMENDYKSLNDYNYVKNKLIENGFIRTYKEDVHYADENWKNTQPCIDNFFEVWKKS